MAEFELSTTEPDYKAIATQQAAGVVDALPIEHIQKAIVSAIVNGKGAVLATLFQQLTKLAVIAGKGLTDLEEPVLPIMAGFVTPMIASMFGTDVDSTAFADKANTEGRNAAADAIVDAFLKAITGDTPEPAEPGPEGATRIAAAGLHAALEGWFYGALPEVLSDFIPFEVGHFSAFTKLPEEVINTLGIGRLIRSALLPLVQATAVEPMRWYANKKYRPTKLGASTIARQLARGRWTVDQAREELAREGYTDERTDALLNEQLKFLTLDDIAFLVWQEILSQDEAVQGLGDQGYDAQTASKILGVKALQREDTIDREIATAASTAFADGRIAEGDFTNLLDATIPSQRERDLLVGAGRAKRALRQVHLSPVEAKACVVGGIIPLSEYRAALERVGYVPDAVDALEMLLRLELDAKLTAKQAQQQLAAEKAAAAQAKALVNAQKKADAEAAAALKRQGSPAELAHAVVRGLIPIARLEQVLAQTLDADTVAIYVADVEQQRQAYLDQQAKAADAAKRAATKGLSTSELSTALVDHVLTVDQVRQQLTGKGLDPADVAVLLASMQQRAADHAAAVATHDAAAARAKNKPIDLAKAEALVRAGHWTVTQYNSLVSSLGFSDAAVADLDLLLQDAIAKDQAAAALRAKAAQAPPAKGLSLAQARTAVIDGTTTLEQFQSYLVSTGYTADATAILMAEARDAVAAADAARARRAATPTPLDGSKVALADVTKAARLGVITPAAYQAELVARGFTADDIALEMDLLLLELGSTRATQNLQPPASAAPAPTGLTLAQIATAVKAGNATIDDYRARAVQLGYSSDDVQTLTNVLTDEVNTLAFASARHTTIAGALTLQGIDIGAIEAAVQAGTQTLDDYEAWILQVGYGAADAALLRALLASKL